MNITTKTFDSIKFNPKYHTYYLGNQRYTSATQLIGQYKPEFKAKFWAKKTAKKKKKTTQEIEAEWLYKKNYGMTKGTIIHNYIESFYNKQEFIYPRDLVIERLGNPDVLDEPFEILKDHFHRFVQETKGVLIPIKSEWKVADKASKIAGTIDQLFYNIQTDTYEIHDWKNNKQFRKDIAFQNWMHPPIDHLDYSCELHHYSLQLHIYKEILKRNTSLPLGDCQLNWLFEGNTNYEAIPTLDMNLEATKIMTINGNT